MCVLCICVCSGVGSFLVQNVWIKPSKHSVPVPLTELSSPDPFLHHVPLAALPWSPHQQDEVPTVTTDRPDATWPHPPDPLVLLSSGEYPRPSTRPRQAHGGRRHRRHCHASCWV